MTTERWDSSLPQPRPVDLDKPSTAPVPTTTQPGEAATLRETPAHTQSFADTQGFSQKPMPAPSPSMESPSKVVAPFEEAALRMGQATTNAAGAGTPNDGNRYLAHFRVDKRLAAGGMGEVYLGFDTSLQRPVAIKTIRPELAADQGFLARFLREATAQANVVHPSVVQVYYVGLDRNAGPSGTWFLAMQVVDGGSLYDLFKDKKKLSWQQAAEHMTGLVEGLVVAEERGIVHRDIKPANILIDRRGKALLADFGLAVAAGAKELPTTSSTTPTPAFASSQTASDVHGSQLQLMALTQIGVVMGTPEYVAPEQLKIGAVDVRADIYALGATFFHLLTGAPVADVRTLPEVIALYEKGHRARPLRTLRPDIPKAFADVVDRCLNVAKEQRPSSMRELLAQLRRASPQPTVPAPPILRVLVWAADVAPFVVASAATYVMAPWAGPALFFLAGMIGLIVVGSSPGIWLLRLRLRTVDDGDVSIGRGFVRFVLQHGWYVPLTIGFSALYASSDLVYAFVFGAVWFAASVVGSAGAFFGLKQTLHDKLTGTRVLVDVR